MRTDRHRPVMHYATRMLTAVVACALGLAACAGSPGATTVIDRIAKDHRVVVGTKWDQPGIGLKVGQGEPQGFDIDVAKYLIKELAGGQTVDIEWKESISSNREAFLTNGTVDIILAGYSITDARKQKVTFAGPYIVAHQDTMVRTDSTGITKAVDLKGKRICQVPGSISYKRITELPPEGKLGLTVQLVGAANYSECVAKLSGSNLDAVTTDDLLLAGYAAQGAGNFRILGDPFTDEQWGVGLKKGDIKTCEAVNTAILKMYSDGTARQLMDKWFGTSTGLTLPTTASPADGCT
jgi:glutamate transport system substrate-binding protein